MPYKDPEAQREYQRQWCAQQRAAYFADKSCVDCGATEDLELDHLDKSKKVSHRIWSWSKKRRDAELSKCVARCGPCHRERHAAERRQDHGLGAYKRGCRCAYCRAAKAAKEAAWRAGRRRRAFVPVQTSLFDVAVEAVPQDSVSEFFKGMAR